MHEPVEISLNSPNDIPMPHNTQRDGRDVVVLVVVVTIEVKTVQEHLLNLIPISLVDNGGWVVVSFFLVRWHFASESTLIR